MGAIEKSIFKEVDVNKFPKEVQKLLLNNTADKVIRKSMTPDDLADIFKESQGARISKDHGRIFDHQGEWGQASNSIKKLIRVEREDIKSKTMNINKELRRLYKQGQYDAPEALILGEKLSDLSRTKDTYTRLIEEAKCQREMSLLKH